MALRTAFQCAVKSCSSSVSVLASNSIRAYSGRFVNHVELLGRVGREPQRIGQNDAVAFPVFTESSVKLKDGSIKTYPCWHRILVVRKTLADAVANSIERGQRCYISGRIAYKEAETGPDGRSINHHQAAIIADSIVFLEKSRKVRENDEPSKEAAESIV